MGRMYSEEEQHRAREERYQARKNRRRNSKKKEQYDRIEAGRKYLRELQKRDEKIISIRMEYMKTFKGESKGTAIDVDWIFLTD